jgi:hypothetical protein
MPRQLGRKLLRVDLDSSQQGEHHEHLKIRKLKQENDDFADGNIKQCYYKLVLMAGQRIRSSAWACLLLACWANPAPCLGSEDSLHSAVGIGWH